VTGIVRFAAQLLALLTIIVLIPAEPQGVERRTASPSRQSPQRAAQVVNRDILAIYDSEMERTPGETRVHRMLEMPLNHLGYRVTYWDMRAGLPTPEMGRNFYAVISWFNERIPEPLSYIVWATGLAQSGTRFVIVEHVGVPLDAIHLGPLNELLAHIGVQTTTTWVPESKGQRILSQNAQMVSFERKLDGNVPGYMVVRPTHDGSPHLTVGHDAGDPDASSPIVTGPGGGYAAPGFANHFDSNKNRVSWIVNPFEFLQAALGNRRMPIPDVTTVAGRRIYFSHIDGDAWNNPSEIPGPAGEKQIVAEAVRDRLILPYPDLPVSIGPIAHDVSPATKAGQRAAEIARELFKLSQVEVASHTHSHPFKWPFFALYARDAELALIEERSKQAPLPNESAYRSGSNDMPRAFMEQPFDLRNEIAGALETSKSLAPSHKDARLYLWSGDTRPFESAIKAAREYGAFNLNGGDTRLDAAYPSVTYVPAIGLPVGGERQIYAVNSNENTYTNGWRGPFDGFAQLSETWRSTDAPRRLKGTNLYYHMYSGQKPESLAAVIGHLENARSSDVIPIAASKYAEIANAFYAVEIQKTGLSAWKIMKRGPLNTLRFDATAGQSINYALSNGVLGHTVHNDALYVALDPAVHEPTIELTSDAGNAVRPYLVGSRWQISNLKTSSCAVTFKARGFGPGDMVWRGLRPGRYAIIMQKTTGAPIEFAANAVDASGELKLALPADGIDEVNVTVHCLGSPLIASKPAPKRGQQTASVARQKPAPGWQPNVRPSTRSTYTSKPAPSLQ
jgi:polysaccharide biosynthesis protein PelA